MHVKKQTGPQYDLNQRLISEMIQIPGAQISASELQGICSGSFSESWKLLEASIKRGKSIFVMPKHITGMQKAVTEGMIEDYIEATKEIFLTFISQIQAQAPTPHCLKEEIPQLNNFFIEVKYLQEDVDLKRIFAGKDKKIFDQLKDYPEAFQRCRDRLKKKPKSGSKTDKKV